MTTTTIAYRPAAERFEAYAPQAVAAREEYFRSETALLQVLTKAREPST